MYVSVKPEDELRQGDVFNNLPWLLFDPCNVGTKSGVLDIASSGFTEKQLLAVHAEPGAGIIVSADCDCANDVNINLCRLRPITEKEPTFYEKGKKEQLKIKLRYQRTKIGVYYVQPVAELPDSFTEFNERSAFPRDFLMKYKHNRIATLTEEARHHLREKIAHHHTRYGPDERYIFTDEEMVVVLEHNILSG